MKLSTPVSVLIAGALIAAGLYFGLNPGLPSVGKSLPANTKTQKPGQKETLVSLAKKIKKVNTSQFEQCLEQEKFKSEVEKDISDASEAGISGTPGFIVGKLSEDGSVAGDFVNGAQPYSVFQPILDKYLDGKGDSSQLVTTSIDDDPILGNKKKAKVAIVEFSDYECPFCKSFRNRTFDKIKKNYIDTNKIILVYRDFPLSFHNPAALRQAQAAECVRDQAGDEAYFKYHDLIFANTPGNGVGIPVK